MAVLIRTMKKGGYYPFRENYLKSELEFAKGVAGAELKALSRVGNKFQYNE